MLKLNTLLTGLAVVLMTVLGFLGKAIYDDVATIKAASISTTTRVDSLEHRADDHETRIRQTEHDVTVLQQDGRIARAKINDNNKP